MKKFKLEQAPKFENADVELEKDKVKIIKGEMYFVYEGTILGGKVKVYRRDLEEWQKGTGMEEYTIYDLIDGKEFAKTVKCGGFIDYDGSISNIFVNDCITNLGIWSNNFHKGKGFYVSLKEFERICDKYKVEVNWANK